MIQIMKNFTNIFMKTLVFNVATICAIIVGLITFAIKAFNENNGAEVVRNFTLTVLDKVDLIVIKLMDLVDTDVPDEEVAQ